MFSWLIRRLIERWGGSGAAPAPGPIVQDFLDIPYTITDKLNLRYTQIDTLDIPYTQTDQTGVA